MLSKRARPEDPDSFDVQRRLGENVRQLYASNAISARRAHTMVQDAHLAGVSSTMLPADPHTNLQNIARHWRARSFNLQLWPDVYWCQIKTWNAKNGQEEEQWVAVHLIHEIMDMIAKLGVPECYGSTDSMDPKAKAHLDSVKVSTGVSNLIGIGLHGDGVPCNWDKSESCEVVSINLPGVEGKWRNMRIPICCLYHSHMGPNTWDDLMEVWAWSLRWCLHGIYPGVRHDGLPWQEGADKRRSKLAGTDLRMQSILLEIRGDWKFFCEAFHMPQWNATAGICWDCDCTAAQVFRVSG